MSDIDLNQLKKIILNICDNFILIDKPFFTIMELKKEVEKEIPDIKKNSIVEVIGILKNENKINSFWFVKNRELLFSQVMLNEYKHKHQLDLNV
ncbi:hypothetical protein DRO31_03280 [Candidatus Bathyarchaeota archaeon]|nr:MAG: hypothetical protein DRO31_03280 [Candidatus Bathyarchaeota archaeon]